MPIHTCLPASPSAASHNTPPASSHEPLASAARRHPGRPLALLMMLSLAACGGSGSDDAGNSAQLTQKDATPVLSSDPATQASSSGNASPSNEAAGSSSVTSNTSTANTPAAGTTETEPPAANTTATDAAAAGTTTGSATAGNTPAANTPAADAAAATDGTAQPAAAQGDLYDDEQFRGDVVLAALAGHAAAAAEGSTPDTTRELIPTEESGMELTKPKLAGEQPQPLLQLDVGIQPSSDDALQQPFTYRAHAEAQPGQTGKAAFHALTLELGLSSGHPDSRQALTIGNVLRFTRTDLNDGKPIVLPEERPDGTPTQLSAQTRVYRKGSYKTWQSEDKKYTGELGMRELDGPDTFLLTLGITQGGMHNQKIIQIRSAWRIPANWKPGAPLIKLGEQVFRESDSPVYNDDGVLSGTSADIDTWSTANYNAEGIVEQTTDAPLSDRGISGALLSASFDSLPDEDYGFNDDQTRLQAASSPTGAFIEQAPEPDSLRVWEDSTGNHFGVPISAENYTPAEKAYRYKMAMGSGQWYDTKPSFEYADIELKIRTGRQGGKQVVFLPGRLKTRIYAAHPDNPDDRDSSKWIEGALMSANGQKGFHDDSLVPFGTVMTWQGQKEGKPLTVKMLLKPGPESNQVTRCWTAALPSLVRDMNREVCSTFVVPSGWQRGQALERVGVYVTDTRPGDNGQPVTRTWRSNPAAPK